MSEAARLMALFSGMSCAHGTHGSEIVHDGKAKHEIKKTARTLHEPVTELLWSQHIAGTRALGIITIREDSTCLWSAIDIDDYAIDHIALIRKLDELSVPAVVVRTKSGGAHVQIYFSEPVPADIVISKMKLLAATLGYPDVEIFPKQEVCDVGRDMLGNWLNMPYFGGNSSPRYAIKPTGLGYSLPEFLKLAESRRMTKTQFEELLGSSKTTIMWSQGPPCLELLSKIGISEGGQRNGVFNLAVLAKKMSPEGWEELTQTMNIEIIRPPLDPAEVSMTLRQLRKKNYSFKCKDVPIAKHCNRSICMTRPFGIGSSGEVDIILSIKIMDSDPPLFYVELETDTIKCDSVQLLDMRKFQKLVLDKMHVILPTFKMDEWNKHTSEMLASAHKISVPAEVGTAGHFMDMLSRFCLDRHSAESRDELLLCKPWSDDITNRTWFRLRDLTDMLDMYKFKEMSRQQIADHIRSLGGGFDSFDIKGRKTDAWWIPSDILAKRAGPLSTRSLEETPI